MAIGLASAAVATGLAFAVVSLVLPHLLDPARALTSPGFPWRAAAAGFGASLIATLVGSAVPALAAARLDVAYALRD